MEKDVAESLDAIAWAHRIVDIKDRNGTPTRFVFKSLSLQDRNICNHIYNLTFEEGKTNGRKIREDLKTDAIKKGLWKVNFDNDTKILKEELKTRQEEQQKLIDQSKARKTLPPALKSLNQRIEYLINVIAELDMARAQYIELPSAEHAAEEVRAYYAVSQSTLCFPDMQRKWLDYNSFLEETDTHLVRSLINAYYRYELETEATIRRIARSPYWRIKWGGSKKNGGVQTLFGREMYDLTLDQFRLVYWSQIYDSAFESMEPPTDEVVDDDEQFDKWLEKQSEKRKQERAQAAMNRKTKDLPEGQEVGMMVDGFYSENCTCGIKEQKNSRLAKHANSCPYGVFIYYHTNKRNKQAEEIQASNPDNIRRMLAGEQKRLADVKHPVEEQHLRRDPATRAALGMPTSIVGKDGKKR